MLAYAKSAATSANMSTNEYIQSVTSFSSAMINSLGGDYDKAAAMSDRAMRQIADNANTFGVYTTQELAGVYQALSKGMYQTLDNLNLGYAGTKDGVKKMLKDAAAYTKETTGEMRDYSIDNFADIVEAIGVIQDKMFITGTTANEAATTVSGSLATLKASWQNLLAGTGSVDDFGTAFENAAANIVKATKEIVPRLIKDIPAAVSSAFGTVLTQIDEAGFPITDYIARAKEKIVPALERIRDAFQPVVDKVKEFADEIGERLSSVSADNVFDAVGRGFDLIATAVEKVMDALENVDFEKLLPIIAGLVAGFEGFKGVLSIINLFSKLSSVIATVKSAATALFAVISANPITIIIAAIVAVIGYLVTLYKTNEDFRNKVNKIVNDVVNFVTRAVDAIKTFFTDTIPSAIQSVLEWFQNIPDRFLELVDSIKAFISEFFNAGLDLIKSVYEGLWNGFLMIEVSIAVWISDHIITPIRQRVSDFLAAGHELIENLKAGAAEVFDSIFTAVTEWVTSNIINPIRAKVGELLAAGRELIDSLKSGAENGFLGIFSAAASWVQAYIISPIKLKASAMLQSGRDLVNNLWSGMKEVWGKIQSWWNGLSLKTIVANVVVNNPSGAGGIGRANGLDYVPYDGYAATLHKGEAVLTRDKAEAYRKGEQTVNGITINQNISSVPLSPVELAAAVSAYFEEARWALI